MRCLCIILILFFTNSVCAQKLKFWIQRTTPCDSEARIDFTKYYLEDIQGKKYYPKRGIVRMPRSELYTVHFLEDPDFEPIQLMNMRGTVLREITENKIMCRKRGSRYLYESCRKLINGFAEDYYANGDIRIRGTFKNGRILDSVVTYHPGSIVKHRTLKVNNNLLVQDYDANGKLIEKMIIQRKF